MASKKKPSQQKMVEPPMMGGWERPTFPTQKAGAVVKNPMLADKKIGDKGAISKGFTTPNVYKEQD